MKRWWEQSEAAFADLVHGLAHLNVRAGGDISADYQRYAGALACFARGYCLVRYGSADQREDAPHIRKFVRDVAMWCLDAEFVEGNALRTLVRKLRDRLELPAIDVAVDVNETLEARRKLVAAISEYDSGHDREAVQRVGYWLGWVLHDVIGNSGGGEKTSGIRRDVVSVALPVLKDLVLRTLEQPQYRLAVYGSLRAGESNHRQIADLGAATYGSVIGTIVHRDSYPVFSWDLSGDDVPVEVYSTTRLTPEKWASLNDFEGAEYRPLLIPVRGATNGQRVVATIYADARS